MTLATRLRSRMRWRGIRSQTQLARLSGVSQSAIHHILKRGDAYAVKRETLRRLAAVLGTTPAWLNGETDAPPPLQEPAAPYAADGYDAEMQALMARLPPPARRKIVDIVRLIAESQPPAQDPAHACATPAEAGHDADGTSDGETDPTAPPPPAARRSSP